MEGPGAGSRAEGLPVATEPAGAEKAEKVAAVAAAAAARGYTLQPEVKRMPRIYTFNQ